MRKYIFAIVTIVLLVCGCSNRDEFKVKGNIEGANKKTLFLEAPVNGRWYILDSVKTSANGDFIIVRKAPRYPEIYRLRFNEKYIYFPIDSIDNIDINSTVSDFSTAYTLSGSDNAVKIMNVDKKVTGLLIPGNKDEIIKVEDIKRELTNQVLANPSSIVAYYIINKYIGDVPLFDPENGADLKIIGAVANAFNTYKPKDPRTAYLVNILLEGQRARRASIGVDTVYIEETPLIDIKLEDNKGIDHNLRKVASKGDVVILNFTLYTAEQSPLYNKILSDVYTKYRSRGVEIFQIAYDSDEFSWKTAAENLPWITVYDPSGPQSKNLTSYNVGSLPMIFIINRKGEISERVTDVTKLDDIIQKYL